MPSDWSTHDEHLIREAAVLEPFPIHSEIRLHVRLASAQLARNDAEGRADQAEIHNKQLRVALLALMLWSAAQMAYIFWLVAEKAAR